MGSNGSKQSLLSGKFTYNVDVILGHGSFGTVYEGQAKSALPTGRKVAVKQCVCPNGQDLITKTSEIEAIKKLDKHPNIVTIHGVDIRDKQYFIIMELCDGGDLASYIEKNKPTMEALLPLFVQCASAVNCLHSSNPPVVHRDIKPQNILLKTVNKKEVCVKLVDFGLAMPVEQSYMVERDAGTKGYMAPELFGDKKRTCPANDTFSLGLVFLTSINFSPARSTWVPCSENTKDTHPVGEQIQSAVKAGKEPPKLVYFVTGESPLHKSVKKVIEDMTHPNRKERTPMTDVHKTLVDIQKNKTNMDYLQKTFQTLSSGYESLRASAKEPPEPSASSGHGELDEEETDEVLSIDSDSDVDEDDLEGGYRILRKMVQQQMPELADSTRRSEAERIGLELPLLALMIGVLAETHAFADISAGDKVRVEDDEDYLAALELMHDIGETELLASILGKEGVVKGRTSSGEVVVEFSDGKRMNINAMLLSKVEDRLSGSGLSSRFKENDLVHIVVEVDQLKKLQKRHGGYQDEMERCIRLRGLVHRTDKDGDVLVEFLDNRKFWFNPDALDVVDLSHLPLESGDLVLILNDYEHVKSMATGHGGWQEEMKEYLGCTGVIKRVDEDGRVRVEAKRESWNWNQNCIKLVAKQEELLQILLLKRMEDLFQTGGD